MEEMTVHTRFWWGDLREREHLEDLGIVGRMTLKWIFKKRKGKNGLDCPGSGKKHVVGTCECSNKPLGSIRCKEFLD
jgi:hypothetical protein